MGRKYRKKRRKWRPVRRTELSTLHTRLEGGCKAAIPSALLKETEGLPWHARCARISAKTGKPFTEVAKTIRG